MKRFIIAFLGIMIFSLMLFVPVQKSFANAFSGAVDTGIEIVLAPDHNHNYHHDWYWYHHHHHEHYYNHGNYEWHH